MSEFEDAIRERLDPQKAGRPRSLQDYVNSQLTTPLTTRQLTELVFMLRTSPDFRNELLHGEVVPIVDLGEPNGKGSEGSQQYTVLMRLALYGRLTFAADSWQDLERQVSDWEDGLDGVTDTAFYDDPEIVTLIKTSRPRGEILK